MPEKKEPGSPWEPVWWVVGLLVVIAIVWYANGGPARSDLRGIFITPPPPVGTGQAYGPTLGSCPTLQENYQESTSSYQY
jgi:hypothetical protein